MIGWVTVAWAAVPVQLPAGESSADWTAPLALADLEWVGDGAAVVVQANGDRWVVTVQQGTATRSATVARPATPDQREDFVWLVVSLRSALEAPAPPPERAAPPPRPRPAPRPPPPPPPPTEGGTTIGSGVLIGTPPAPEPAPAAPAEEVIPDSERELDDLALPRVEDPVREVIHTPSVRETRPARAQWPKVPTDRALGPWARVSGGWAVQPRVAGRPVGTVEAGASRRWWALGGHASWGPTREVPGVGPARSVSGVELGVQAWARGPVVAAGLAVGAEARTYTDAGDVVARGAMPFLRGELALGIRLGNQWTIEPSLAARVDLGFTQLQIDGIDAGTFAGRSLAPTLGLRWR